MRFRSAPRRTLWPQILSRKHGVVAIVSVPWALKAHAGGRACFLI
jgi:hypothetical protein